MAASCSVVDDHEGCGALALHSTVPLAFVPLAGRALAADLRLIVPMPRVKRFCDRLMDLVNQVVVLGYPRTRELVPIVREISSCWKPDHFPTIAKIEMRDGRPLRVAGEPYHVESQ